MGGRMEMWLVAECKPEHFLAAVNAGAAVLLAASVFHFNTIGIHDLKIFLREHGVPVRLATAEGAAP